MLKINNITKHYGKFLALDNVSLEIHNGEIMGLLGPNGAGKSTLIKILTCFHKQDSGDAIIDGISIKDQKRVKKVIGYAPQEDSFYDNLTLMENLKYFGGLYNMPLRMIKKRSEELLELLMLKNKKDELAKNLSGGMKKRLNIAIALIHKPKILFLDEPTVGVDPLSRAGIWEVVEKIKKEGMTILYCTHYLTEADRLCDRVAIIKEGKIVLVETPEKIKKKYGETLEDAFIKLIKEEK
ncbi:ATP-binding cassette domain-containing protein [Candidatus Woesearchaeota archaeon]|nr:ATP-binding cassette domain-containing protein [Candidatus Woesearchaeota archaeon]